MEYDHISANLITVKYKTKLQKKVHVKTNVINLYTHIHICVKIHAYKFMCKVFIPL